MPLKKPAILASLLVCLLSLSGHSVADKAVFAGGCFWCMESDFQDLEGVRSVVSGYTGGHTVNPTYKQVSRGGSGHYEAVEIDFDASIVSYPQLLAIYWRNIDPFDSRGQFCDKGESYRSAIFALDASQRQLAEQSKSRQQQALEQRDLQDKIVTLVLGAATFYPAEYYHQDYYQKNPTRYKFYRWNCGRDKRLQQVWGDAEVLMQ